MVDNVFQEQRSGIEKAHEALKRDLSRVRTGRAHAGMLDSIRVDFYGTPTPLQQMASISIPEPRMITIKPWDKSVLKFIDKAIRESDLGLNPMVDSDVVRLPIPALTEERRKEMVKSTKKIAEDSRVAIRKHRRDAIEMLEMMEKEGDISEDDADRAKKKVEEITAEGIKQADAIASAKEKDILEV